jgi:hypothetical protein
MLIDVNCPLCQNETKARFDRRVVFGQAITNHICSRCGLVFMSPRMPETELEAFYEQEYRQLYQGSSEPNPKDLAVQQGRAEALLDFTHLKIEALSLPRPFRHLDIGCSAGLLLEKFQEVFNSMPVGIEPGQAYRQFAQSRNLRVYASLEEVRQNDEKPFEFISLAHVLEHIPDPVHYLERLRLENHAKGGLLLVEVPNLYGHDCFEIAHLVSYSSHTLTQTLKKAGYQVQALQVHGRPRSLTLPLYITVLARAGQVANPGEILPETGVRRKRQAALFKRNIQTRLSPKKAWIRL